MGDAEYEREASRLGLGFPLTAGVTAAVVDTVKALGGEVRKAEYASGLDNCYQKVKAAAEGKRVLICPYCKEKLRVPVGAGKIKIKCPHCNQEFEETV